MKNKTLLFDIETSPILCYTWGMYEENALKVVKQWEILSFAYRWLGEKTQVLSLREYTEKELVTKLWELFSEAEIIIGHNGDKFDIKKSNAKFIEHGLTPPEPYKSVDTLKIARKYFKFNSNRLDALGEVLGVGRKIKTGGFDLWDKCMQGDETAFKKMELYNKRDVDLLERVYLKLRPWIHGHPNINLLNGTTHHCPNCGSKKVQKRGFAYTRTNKYQRFQCLSCFAWSQAPENKVLR